MPETWFSCVCPECMRPLEAEFSVPQWWLQSFLEGKVNFILPSGLLLPTVLLLMAGPSHNQPRNQPEGWWALMAQMGINRPYCWKIRAEIWPCHLWTKCGLAGKFQHVSGKERWVVHYWPEAVCGANLSPWSTGGKFLRKPQHFKLHRATEGPHRSTQLGLGEDWDQVSPPKGLLTVTQPGLFPGVDDLLSASMFVKSPAEFIPIQDECSDFGHVAGKHCLHAWNKETRAKKKKWHAERILLQQRQQQLMAYTYFLPLTAL